MFAGQVEFKAHRFGYRTQITAFLLFLAALTAKRSRHSPVGVAFCLPAVSPHPTGAKVDEDGRLSTYRRAVGASAVPIKLWRSDRNGTKKTIAVNASLPPDIYI